MISHYHYKKKSEHIHRLPSIDDDVLRWLVSWIDHYARTAHRCSVAVRYDLLQADTAGNLSRVLDLLIDNVDPTLLQKSVELSAFDNIKSMGRETGQARGNHADTFKGEFTRSGKSGQYLAVLKPRTIELARWALTKNGLNADELCPLVPDHDS